MADIAAMQRTSFEHCSPATAAAFPEPRRMTEDQLVRFLERKEYLVLALTRSDGRPHAAMSAFCMFDDRFWSRPWQAPSARATSSANLGSPL
jgi:hypothetical protein